MFKGVGGFRKFLALVLTAACVAGPMSQEIYASQPAGNDIIIGESVNELPEEFALSDARNLSDDLVPDDTVPDELKTEEDNAISVNDIIEEEAEAEPAANKYATGYRRSPNYEAVDSVNEGDVDRDKGNLEAKYINSNLSPLRDQNPYGTCWAFASMGLAEMNLRQKGIIANPDLSELHLAYFAYNTQTDPLGGTEGDGTELASRKDILMYGGDFEQAGNVMAQWIGAADENKVRYSDMAENVNDGETLAPDLAFDDRAHLEDMYIINIKEDPDEVKEAIKKYGGVGISFRADDGTSPSASNKIYNKSTNSYYNPDPLEANHAVMIVGWDDEYDRNNFNMDPGSNGAWLVRNSWRNGGDINSKGYDAYFWMSYKEGTLEPNAYVFVFDNVDDYDHNYQYDGGIYNGYFPNSYGAANIFTVKGNEDGTDEELRAVSFSTQSVNTSYTIKIYTDLTNSKNPESGTLAATRSGRTGYAGFHTIELDDPVRMSRDTIFSVVVDLTQNPTGADMVYEYPRINGGDISARAKSSAGQSFVKFIKNGSWSDINSYGYGNVRIKAFTCDLDKQVAPTYINLNGIDISSGLKLDKGKYRDLTYSVGPDGATNKTVNFTSENEGVATVELISHNDTTGSGKIRVNAVGVGQTLIRAAARSGEAVTEFKVIVSNPMATGIRIVQSTDTSFKRGETCDLTVMPVPEEAEMDAARVSWKSLTPDVAVVLNRGDKGQVTVKTAGKAKIQATYTRSDGVVLTGTAEINCLPAAPSVSLTQRYEEVYVNWNATEGAEKYVIWRMTSEDDVFTRVKEVAVKEGAKSYSEPDEAGPDDVSHVTYKVEAYEKGFTSYGSATLYLQKANTITYKPGNGDNDPRNPSKIAQGQTVSLYPPIAPEGYSAEGWYEEKAKKLTNVLPVEENNYRDFILSARYKANTYTVRYYANEGEGEEMADSVFTYDKAGTLKANTYTMEGCDFMGWNTESDGTGSFYADKASVKNLTSKNGGVVKLYAQWGSGKFNITLDAGEGLLWSGRNRVSKQVISVPSNGKYQNLPTPELEGHYFDGWYIDPDIPGTRKKDGDMISRDDFGEEPVLYAKYSPIKTWVYFIDVNEDNKNPYTKEITVEYGKPYGQYGGTWTLPNDSKGRLFTGWYLDEDCLNKVTADTIVTETGDHFLYAGWYEQQKTDLRSDNIYINAEKIAGTNVYPEESRISMYSSDEGAVIYYTIDGSDPKNENNENVYVYTGPFSAYKEREAGSYDDYDLKIRAYAERSGYKDSDVISKDIRIRPIQRVKAEGMTDADFTEYGKRDYPEGLWIAGIRPEGYTYRAGAITPDVRVYYGRKLLLTGTDYKLTVKNNISAYTDETFETVNAPTVSVKCKGNYKGELSDHFIIKPLQMTGDSSLSSVSLLDAACTYNGQVQKGIPGIIIAFRDGNTIELKEGRDFECEYPGTDPEKEDYKENAFRNIGTHKGKVTFKKNYNGNMDFNVIITDLIPMSAVKLDKIPDHECDGTAFTPEPVLSYKGEKLIKGTDYTVSYMSNNIAGTGRIIMTGKGRFSGTKVGTFGMKGRPIKKCNVNGFRSSVVYTGNPIEQNEVKLTYKGNELIKGTDYTVEYSKNINKGTATVIFSGNPDKGVTGTLKKTFKILPYAYDPYADDQLLLINTIYDREDEEADYEPYDEDKEPEVPYTKGGACPDIMIISKTAGGEGAELVEGSDYKLTCKNNKTVNGRKYPVVKISFMGNYKGSTSRYFTIVGADISSLDMTANDKVYENKAGKYTTGFAVYDTDGKKLKAGTDFDKDVQYCYYDDTWLEDGSFRGQLVPVQKGDIPPIGTMIMITAQGKGAYSGEISCVYRIVKADISSAKVGNIAARSYTGDPIELDFDDISLKIKGQELGAGDFIIDETSYKKNVNMGTASVTLIGTGEYGGRKTIKFKIVNRKL